MEKKELNPLMHVPEMLTTTEGMAMHLANLANHADTRPVAQEWFSKMPLALQLHLIDALRDKYRRARELVYLVPDAAILLARMDVSLLRRVCDDEEVLIAALEPEKALEIIRCTERHGLRLRWIEYICHAFRRANRLDELFGAIDPDELASFYADQYCGDDADLLRGALSDPEELGDEFLLLLYCADREKYDRFVIAIAGLVDARVEWKARLRGFDEMGMRPWREPPEDENDA